VAVNADRRLWCEVRNPPGHFGCFPPLHFAFDESRFATDPKPEVRHFAFAGSVDFTGRACEGSCEFHDLLSTVVGLPIRVGAAAKKVKVKVKVKGGRV
jgi:hypothetical protein